MSSAQPHYPRSDLAEIWDMKYRFKRPDGAPVDQTVEDSWRRVAEALAEAEEPSRARVGRATSTSLLEDYSFLPAGRILAGAGTGRNVTLFNCFVMGTHRRSMAGIFEHLKEAALTMQQGGGIGYRFLDPAAQGRAGERRRRGCLRAFELHGCVGLRCAAPSCRRARAAAP